MYKIIESDKLGILNWLKYKLHLFLRHKNNLSPYDIGVRYDESIISYRYNGKMVGFMIGRVTSDNIGRFFNLEYIYSFQRGIGKDFLLDYMENKNVNRILYIERGSGGFWRKIENMFKEKGIEVIGFLGKIKSVP